MHHRVGIRSKLFLIPLFLSYHPSELQVGNYLSNLSPADATTFKSTPKDLIKIDFYIIRLL